MLLRLRLALFYTSIMVLLLAVFSSAVFFVQSRVTLEAAKADLTQAASQINEAAHRISNSLDVPAAYDSGRLYVQTREPGRAVASRSPNLAVSELPLSEAGWAALERGRTWHETETVDGEPM